MRGFAAGLLAAAVLALCASPALAATAFFTDADGDSLLRVDTATNLPIGAPTAVGDGPFSLAISPDGASAYVATANPPGALARVDARSGQLLGAPLVLGGGPGGIAISPNGRSAYVSESDAGTVVRVDLASNQVVGLPIGVSAEPGAIAISPDGLTAYVVNEGSKTVSVIDTRTNQVVGSIPVGDAPRGIAITPSGATLYVTNMGSASVTAIDARTNTVIGAPIAVGAGPKSVAISPDGSAAFVASKTPGTVSVIDTRTNQVTGPPIAVAPALEQIAITPDGRRAYVTSESKSVVSVIDTQARTVIASPDVGGLSPFAIAFAPAQPPRAAFTVAKTARPGVPLSFDASASSDPDGSIASYAWAFGDNQFAVGGPVLRHAFAAPGSYRTVLTLADDEGCSTALIFTGQTASCDGGPSASQALTVKVAYPGVRARCPKSAKPAGCKLSLQAVDRKPAKSGHGRKPKPETKVARLKLKAGRSAIVSLLPKKRFVPRLAVGRKVVVKVKTTIAGASRTGYQRLKIVE